jgi:hypothetical protein
MRAALLLPVLAIAQAAAGCQSTESACTLVACQDGVGVTLGGVAAKLAPSLPVTLTVCLDTSCSSFKLNHTGQAPTCTALSAGDTLCSIDGEGTVALTTLPLPPGTAPGASLVVLVTAADGMGNSLLSEMQSVTIVETQPNGPDCAPTCLGAHATFPS